MITLNGDLPDIILRTVKMTFVSQSVTNELNLVTPLAVALRTISWMEKFSLSLREMQPISKDAFDLITVIGETNFPAQQLQCL